MENDYSALIGFIYSTSELGNKSRFAKYFGISFQAIQQKLKGESSFTQKEIMKLKKDFNLSPEQIDRYFFTSKLLKGN